MRSNRRADTRPERRVRSLLHRQGYRFRKDAPIAVADGSVRADIVFPRARLAVFIDGCFWHCCPEHGTRPNANNDYWGPKLDRNVERDRLTGNRLRDAGWTVLRVWEHAPADEAVAEIVATLRATSY